MAARYSQFARRPPPPITECPLVSRTFVRAAGGYPELQVVDHSLEIEARLGPAWIETRFGELSIQLDFELPATVFAACVCRFVANVEADFPRGQRLVVATGSVDYRRPWAR